MGFLAEIESQVLSWPEVSVHPHRFGGREFRFRDAEIGHVHANGIVDIPFPRSIHDALLDEGLAEQHHWVPDSGWITYRVRGENDFSHALWLMRLSYLRYGLKTAEDPLNLLERESQQLHLRPRFKTLFAAFLPNSVRRASADPVPA
ncbi:MAG TPA: luciferase family protein [Verrucomicrobiae bacterium]|jgi:hypothetical protein|nr:luciferase family protein [Verrucomicrobiae bacterium]